MIAYPLYSGAFALEHATRTAALMEDWGSLAASRVSDRKQVFGAPVPAPVVLPEELPDLAEWPDEFDLSAPYGPLLARNAAVLGYIDALDAEARYLAADPLDLTPWLLDFDHPDLHAQGEGA